MALYDPQTLVLLRQVLDEAWAALPDHFKSQTLKSEVAQHILKQAANGVRDPVRLRTSALMRTVDQHPHLKSRCASKDAH
jgi:hypothetical protein